MDKHVQATAFLSALGFSGKTTEYGGKNHTHGMIGMIYLVDCTDQQWQQRDVDPSQCDREANNI